MSTKYRCLTLAGAAFSVLLMGPVLTSAQSNILLNPSFETGESSWTGSSGWGAVVTTNNAYEGTNAARFNAYASTKSLYQSIPMSAQRVYEVDAWFKTVSGPDQFAPTAGYAMVRVQFYDASGTLISGNANSPRIGTGMTTSWTRYTTDPILTPAGTVTGKVTCYYVNGGDATTNGYFLVDQIRAYTSTATRAGALLNPDFEMQPYAALGSIPYWSAFGGAGGVVTNLARNGHASLQVYFTQNMAYQTWVATAGARYACSGYMLTPGLTTTNNAHGVIVMEYFDVLGTNLGSFLSAYLTKTNATNQWVYYEATGVAPVGTVTGRTMCAILGVDTTFTGSVFFDDITQRSVASTDTVSGILHNPGFDDGGSGNAYDLDVASALPYWKWLGGTNAGFVTGSYAYDGIQSLSITYPGNMAGQRAAAVTGRTYILEGYMSSPVGQAISNDAYGVFFMEFYSTSYRSGTTLVSVAESPHFTSNYTAGTWYKFSVTNTAPWVGSVTCRVLAAVMGNTTNYGGAVHFDGMTLIETNITRANSQSGTIWNPGFEYTANGTVFDAIDSWTNFGDAGSIDSLYTRTGIRSLRIYFVNNLLGQNWPVTPGYTYSSAAYAYTPSSGADKFVGGTNTHGVVVIDFLDATGTNVLQSFASPYFTTNSPMATWVPLSVTGKAPVGAVSARTMLAIQGTNVGFSGSIWFDDVSQSTVSTGGTSQAGVIYNGGFDDGVAGDCYFLSNNLPNWKWLGGSNAGFIASGVAQSNNQSLTIVWPDNLAAQDFAATTGLVYTAEGYMMTPSANRMTGSTAYATILLEFYSSIGTGASVSAVNTIKLTNGTPADTWLKVSVTNRAPWMGTWVTGRVSCALLGGASNYGGQVYFDSVRVSVTTSALANTSSGTIWNPGFEFSALGTKIQYIDSWTNFGEAGGLDSTYTHGGNNALRIYFVNNLLGQNWPVTPGYTYSSAAYAYTPSSGADKFVGGTNTHGVVLIDFLDATGTNVLLSFASPYFTTNSPTATWVPLSVTGKAPVGAVSARTMLAIQGTNVGFSGSIWFDDVSQSTVSTGGTTQAGVIYNGGFEDGVAGDCYFLSNNLPNWKWLGGSNAGFIASGVAQSNNQSLTIVWPDNLAAQDFAAQTGLTYTVEGYMMTPSAGRLTGTTAYAQFLLEFFTPAGGVTSVSVVGSAKLTNGTAVDTWIKFGVTNRAPYVGGWVTGRVSCALLGGAANYGGQVYFDSVRVTVTTVTVNNTTNGTIRNPGFEYSAEGTRLSFIDNWQGLGLDGIVDSTYKRSGSQSLKIFVPETLAAQSWPATSGYRYSSQAYVYTPTETEGANLLVNGALSLVGPGEAPTGWSSFDNANHEADYWNYVSGTNAWMFYWSGGIYQEVTTGFTAGERYKFGGLLYQTSTGLTNGDKYGVIQLEFYNSTNGLISTATAYPMINSNSLKGAWFGTAGSATVPVGTAKMQIVVRCNVTPTYGDGSFTADDIFLKKVPAVAERFTAPFDTHGVVLLQYLNSTGTVIATYESPYFTTNSAGGVWTNFMAAGVAPVGTVSGRTVVAILGSTTGFSGALWFDDVSQSLVSTGATQAGVIWNGGFDDGVVGNCYYLSNSLPNWTWIGGTNAGFIVDTVSQTTNQSLTIVWPDNLAAQDFAAQTGLTYTVEGYMMTPSAGRMTGTTAYAQFLLEFFTPAGGVTSVSVVGSAKVTNGTPADTWIKFGVTNRAPYAGGWVTGRVSCALLGGAANYGGQVYFDSVRVTVTTVTVNNTTNGTIRNPGFEYSAEGTRLSFIDNWQGLGLDGIVDSTYKRSGSQSLKIFVPETLSAQSWPATPGYRYSSQAYVYTPTETEGTDLLVNGALNLVGPGQAPTGWSSFDDGSHEADYWHYVSGTNAWMFYWGGGIYQEITTGFMAGERYTFGGSFFMESGNPLRNGDKYGVIQLEFYNSTNGLISTATAYPMINSNSVKGAWFGTAGSATVPVGTAKMQIVVRCNVPTAGDGSFTAEDIFLKKVPAVAEHFTSPFDAHGVVLLQYLNSTGGVISTYESPYFTTNSTPGAWTNLMAGGVAPMGTVSGRTVVAILGSSTGFTGALWFDDVSQSLVSTGTMSGLLHNPSFEDGIPGNCAYLSNDLPYWTWSGGTNAGYIATDHTKDGQQSLVITYPQNGLFQDMPCVSNHTYVVSGYLFTPSAARFSSDGTSYGWLDMAFYVNGFYVTNYTSQKFTGDIPANQWTNFTVSGTAPDGTNVTAKLTCTIFSVNPGEDLDLGGVIYFDQLSFADQAGGQPSEWAQWQQQNFGSTNGANTGLYEDYDNDGYLNWNEFIAGSQATNKNSVWESTASKQAGNDYVIRWPSVAGRYYKVNRSTNFMTTAFTPISGTLAANVPENVYTDSPPTSVTLYYYRVSVTTNQP